MVARLPIIHPYHHALNAEVAIEVVGTTTGTTSNWVVPVPSQHLVDTRRQDRDDLLVYYDVTTT